MVPPRPCVAGAIDAVTLLQPTTGVGVGGLGVGVGGCEGGLVGVGVGCEGGLVGVGG